jgi:hypothetical protein
VRPDYVKLLEIIAKGNFRGPLAEVAKTGAAGHPAADRLIRAFIHDHLEYRFVVVSTADEARANRTAQP